MAKNTFKFGRKELTVLAVVLLIVGLGGWIIEKNVSKADDLDPCLPGYVYNYQTGICNPISIITPTPSYPIFLPFTPVTVLASPGPVKARK